MVVTISILGADAQLSGKYPVSTVIDATSFFKAGYQYSPRYKAGMWDGRIRLFRRLSSTFPAGLVDFVKDALENEGVTVAIDDKRLCPPIAPLPEKITLFGVSFEYPYDYQLECMREMVIKQRGIIHVATGGGKTEIACLVAACLRLPTLFIVPGRELLYQTQKRFAKRFDIPVDDIGIIGDGQWRPNQWITVAIVASLYEGLKAGKERVQTFLDKVQLLFIDECHHGSAESYYDVARACNAYFRFGMSGTPMHRTDGADLKLIAITGPVIYAIRNKFLIERGVNCSAEINLVSIREPTIPKKTPYQDVYRVGITENTVRNRKIGEIASQLVAKGRRVVILVREIAHGKQLDKKLWTFTEQPTLTHQFINGQESTFVRQKALKDFENGDLSVLIATSILDEGVDLPCIDAIILAGGGKSTIKTLQRIGRGLRQGDGTELIVVDMIDFQHRYLLQHSQQRLLDYKTEDCFDITEWSDT